VGVGPIKKLFMWETEPGGYETIRPNESPEGDEGGETTATEGIDCREAGM